MKRFLGLALTIVIIGYFVYYFFRNQQDLVFLKSISFPLLFGVLLAHLSITFLNGLYIKIVLIPFGIRMAVTEAFAVSSVSSIANFITPFRGGMGFRAVYLKKKYQVKYSQFVSLMYGNYLMIFFVYALGGLGGLLIAHQGFTARNFPLFMLFGVFVVLPIAMYCLPRELLERICAKCSTSHFVLNKLGDAIGGWNQFIFNKKVVFQALFVSTVSLCANFFLVWAVFASIEKQLPGSSVIVYTALYGFSMLIAITPGALGIREAVFLVFSTVIGINGSEIAQSALVDRSILFLALIVLFTLLNLCFRQFLRFKES